MRRAAAIGLGMVLTATLAAGCGDSGGSGSGDTGTVTLWMYPVIADQAKSQAFWSKVERDFEAANQGIDVTIDLQPWEGRQEKVTTALASGKGFDLVVLGPDQIPQYVQQGALASVDEALAGQDGQFRKNALDGLSVDGKRYGVPIYHTATLPVYNKAALAKAGITDLPDTWDEIRDAAPKLAAQGVAVLDYPGAPDLTLNLSFYPLLWQNDGSVFSPDGKSVAFNEPAGVEALQFLLDLKAAGGLTANAASAKLDVAGSATAEGKAAIMPIAQLSQAQQLVKLLGADNVSVGGPIEGKERVAFGLPGGVVMAKRSPNQAAATKLLRYLSAPQVMAELCKESGFFPPRTDVTVPGADPLAQTFADAIDMLSYGDTHPKARQVMSVLGPQVQAALLGQKSAKQALDDAAKEVQPLLAG